jgi:Ca2+/Na+ antiporter
MTTDLLMVALGSLLILIFVYTNKKHQIKRWQGGMLIAAYTAYLIGVVL